MHSTQSIHTFKTTEQKRKFTHLCFWKLWGFLEIKKLFIKAALLSLLLHFVCNCLLLLHKLYGNVDIFLYGGQHNKECFIGMKVKIAHDKDYSSHFIKLMALCNVKRTLTGRLWPIFLSRNEKITLEMLLFSLHLKRSFFLKKSSMWRNLMFSTFLRNSLK